MKFIALLTLLISVNVFAARITCTNIQGNGRTDVTIVDDKYIVRYSDLGNHFPGETILQGEATAEVIHDSITRYTLHDFIYPGKDAEFIHYGVVADFDGLRMNCRNI